jgi:DNA-binding NtrC family response regulator
VLAPDAVARLTSYDWPGNVRELENALTRALVLARGATLTAGDLALGQEPAAAEDMESADALAVDQSLATIERAHIVRVLQRAQGNKRQACRVLRISRPRLDRLLEKHGIR